MADNYWDSVTRSRVSRRRVMRGGAGAGLGIAALSLIGCGDDDEGGTPGSTATSASATGSTAATGATGATGPAPTTAPSSLVSQPEDTTANAKYGGTFIGQADTDPTTFDVITGLPEDVAMAARAYSRIIKYKSFKYPD